MPLADTEKDTLAPAFTVWPDGWAEIEGATVAGLTVKVAPLLVTDPAELVATTVYVPALPAFTLPMLYDVPVAPPIGEPLNCHCKVGAGVPSAAALNVTPAPSVTV